MNQKLQSEILLKMKMALKHFKKAIRLGFLKIQNQGYVECKPRFNPILLLLKNDISLWQREP